MSQVPAAAINVIVVGSRCRSRADGPKTVDQKVGEEPELLVQAEWSDVDLAYEWLGEPGKKACSGRCTPSFETPVSR